MTEYSAEELAQRTHDHLNTYISSADQKASILLTAQFAFIGLFGNGVGAVWKTAGVGFKAFSGLTAIAGLVSIVFSGLVIYPRSPTGNEGGLIFWESIINRDQDQFVAEMSSLSNQAALDELVQQNYVLAKVADQKYGHTKISLIATAVMVGFASISTIIFFV